MKKANYRSINYRYVLIAIFTFALVELVYIALHRKKAAENLEYTLQKLNEKGKAISNIDKSIEGLFNLENKFRKYALTRNTADYDSYKSQLVLLTQKLDSVAYFFNNHPQEKDKIKLKVILNDKKKNTALFLRLKLISDSLITATNQLGDIDAGNNLNFRSFKITDIKSILDNDADTAVNIAKLPKKSLFKRLGSAFSNKQEISTDTLITNNNSILRTKIIQDSLTLKAVNALFTNNIKRISANQKLLQAKELEIIQANGTLLDELLNILKELKQQEQKIRISDANFLNKQAKENLEVLNGDTKIVFILTLILAIVIIFNVWRLSIYEHQLVDAKNKAVLQSNHKSDYLAHLSHEIRTPLNSILGFSEQLEKTHLVDEQVGQISAIRESSNILLSLVNDILDLSKLEAGNLTLKETNFSPEKAIRDVVKSLGILAHKKGLDLNTNFFFEKGFMISGDEYRFKQVLINITNNAIKFTNTGSITINGRLASAETLRIEIIDTGIGISKENISTLFDDFTQILDGDSSERQNGTGLGLSISKKIIEAQNGKIKVESVVGKGSTFIIEIPFKLKKIEKQHSTNTENVTNRKLQIKNALIVDDNVLNIKLIKHILKKWDIQCDEAENGEIAYNLFTQKNYDVILTDIEMPILNGVELMKKIRAYNDERKAKVSILAITANAMADDLAIYRAAGASDLVVKPFKEDQLFEALLGSKII